MAKREPAGPPDQPRFVRVVDADGTVIPSKVRGEKIVALVMDEKGTLLWSGAWPVKPIRKHIAKLRKEKASDIRIVNGLIGFGEEAQAAVSTEIVKRALRKP